VPESLLAALPGRGVEPFFSSVDALMETGFRLRSPAARDCHKRHEGVMIPGCRIDPGVLS
jgi:hypothetical protein